MVARNKDITLDLLRLYNIPFTVLAPIGYGTFGSFRELVQREIKLFFIGRKFKPDIITGTSVNAARVAKLLRVKSVILNEDDASVVPLFRWLAYPLATAVVTPESLEYEDYGTCHITYPSYQKLFYLHPNRFTPDRSIFRELGLSDDDSYAIIRTSALTAHHDRNIRGISDELIRAVLKLLNGKIRIFLSSEKGLESGLGTYPMRISPERMHHALAFAEFFIGDSQSMTMEAALLGTPAFRINSFAGRITVIKELEDYGLAFGFLPGQENALIDELKRLLAMKNRKEIFRKRRETMLLEKIDPLPWFLNVIDMMLHGKSVREINEAGMGNPRRKD